MPDSRTRNDGLASKVPQVTLGFWFIKVLATTFGETGGDALSMTLHLGYAVSSLIFLGLFAATLAVQLARRGFNPVAYWAVVVATTTVGTTVSDYLDRTLKLGYPRASLLLFAGVVAMLAAWRLVMGRIRFEDICSRRDEAFYWMTILVSNTLGTALGDFTADSGLGFERSAIVFAGLIAVVAVLHLAWKRIPTSILFWSAYVLTRPLGATLGDTLTKPHAEGGLALGRFASSFVILAAMAVAIAMAWRSRSHAGREPARG